MLIITFCCRSLLSGIHHAYQVKGTVGSGNASYIRVFGPELYRTVPLGGNEPKMLAHFLFYGGGCASVLMKDYKLPLDNVFWHFILTKFTVSCQFRAAGFQIQLTKMAIKCKRGNRDCVHITSSRKIIKSVIRLPCAHNMTTADNMILWCTKDRLYNETNTFRFTVSV